MKFLTSILLTIIPQLLELLTPDVIREGLDAFLDIVEDRAVDSTNKIDDALVLPICKVFRFTLNIPDNDPPA